MCCPMSVTTFSCSWSCCHCPVAASGVSVAAASLFSLWLLSSPSHRSCCPCDCHPAAHGTDGHLSVPHQGAEAVHQPQAQSHLTSFTVTAHYHPPSNDASWDHRFTGGGGVIVTLLPVEAAGPLSEAGPGHSKNPALLRVSTLEPSISLLYLFLEMKAS